MTDELIRANFSESAEKWVCDGYSVILSFFATWEDERWLIRGAAVNVNPLPASGAQDLVIENDELIAGQIYIGPDTQQSVLKIVDDALTGTIVVEGKVLELPKEQTLYFYSESNLRDRWFSDLHIQVSGVVCRNLSQLDLINLDNALRSSSPPFDGLSDLSFWLNLTVAENSNSAPTISVRVNPPVDLILDRCLLNDDKLSLVVNAHNSFNKDDLLLAVRAVPGSGLDTRLQAANKFSWRNIDDVKKEGTATIDLSNADNAQVILMVGRSAIRRQWFLDPTKARNSRLLTVQHYDKDLRMVKNAVLESTDSNKFENGIAVVLFLLGFTPAVQIETDSPDIVVCTPGGRTAIVECTMRVADFSKKLGKLVDRKGSLEKHLQASGHKLNIASVLICRQPQDQIAAGSEITRSHNVILITREDLESFFERLRYPSDPDRLLIEAEATARSKTPDLFE